MEGFKLFLESSTIHGLTYISTMRRLTRLFWILVVLGGFSCALYLIHESFNSWADSPITTTIETLPIRKITFPKVTVCPPKDTYTDLNYDLILANDITLSDETRLKLLKNALSKIDDISYMDKLNMLHEDYRFYNWYYRFTGIGQPRLDEDTGYTKLHIDTTALAGTVYTQYFGEPFKNNKVANKVSLAVEVNIPRSIRYDNNVTLHFIVEKHSMQGLSKKSEEQYLMSLMDGGSENLLPELTFINRSFTPPRYYSRPFGLIKRDVATSDIDTAIMDLMPGFKFSWFYTGIQFPLEPEPLFYHEGEIYIEFVKFVNLIALKNLDVNSVWMHVREVRKLFFDDFRNKEKPNCNYDDESFATIDDIIKNTEAIKSAFGITIALSNTTQAFSWQFIDYAGRLFVYLNSCPDQSLIQFYEQLINFENRSLSEMIILTLNSVKNSPSESLQTVSKTLLKELALEAKFQYNQPNFGFNEEDWSRDMKNVKDLKLLNVVKNHPVHVTKDKLSSSFIPFCSFGQ